MTQPQPFISICIPAYKRVEFLRRLLDSIVIQSYKDFEVIVSDDSPGTEVGDLLRDYALSIDRLIYSKNSPALGTPANWNAAIRLASGGWVKLMHDDDWFASADSLAGFARVAEQSNASLLFSSYRDVLLSSGKEKTVRPGAFRFRQLKKERVTLLSKNIIGPPSVVMHPNDGQHVYDESLKWLVDIDMYVRRMGEGGIAYIPSTLVKVGVGDEQVTVSVHGAPEVEIPEHFHFLAKTGIAPLKNIFVYDYWWRLFRNFSIMNVADLERNGYHGRIHPVLFAMIMWQRKIPHSLLRIGLFSKIFMFLHYHSHRDQIK